MNYRLLSKILGLLLVLLGVTMLTCLVYAWLQSPREVEATKALAWSFGITVGIGGAMAWAGRGTGRQLLRKEAIAIVGLGWILCALFGALPYCFCSPSLSMADAFFESMSGFTTTGSTVITNLDTWPRSILLWRALTQWLGGLGILVLFVALLSYLGVGSKALFGHESSAHSSQGLQARIHDVAVRLWLIYLALTVVCVAGLMGFGMNLFEAVAHTFTAISTGGFSPENRSIAAYGSLGIELWLVTFMLLGSVSFILYAWLLRGRWDRWHAEEEARWFILVVLAATVVIALDLMVLGHHGAGQALRESLFHVVSIITTTGYATEDYNAWPPFSAIVLLALMCVGGCAGSTAGGLKVGRWLLFMRVVHQQVVNAFRPNLMFPLKINGHTIDESSRTQALFLFALAGVSIFAGTGLVSMLEPAMDMDSSVSAVMACLFNIGPGLGMVGPTENFAFLGPATKLILSGFMLLGRLEFFAVLVLFSPMLWRKY